MSSSKNIEVNCPHCGEKQNFIIWQAANVSEDVALKEKIFTQKLFSFECKNCGAKAYIEYPFIYHDSVRRFFIYYDPDGKFENLVETKGYITKKTKDYLELLELARILEDGMDVEIVEKLKANLFKKFASSVELNKIDKLYYSSKKGTKVSFFVPFIKGEIEVDLPVQN